MRFAMISFVLLRRFRIDISDTHCRSSAGGRTIRQIGDPSLVPAADQAEGPSDEPRLRLLADARRRELPDNEAVEQEALACGEKGAPPPELASSDPEVLRAALAREHDERLRAECLATMQAEVVQLALDLLVREPDLEGFFGGLTKNMVEETDSRGCSVWLIDHEANRCALWLAYMNDQLYTSRNGGLASLRFPHEALAAHLFGYKPGWTATTEYGPSDERLPETLRKFCPEGGVHGMVVTPLVIGGRTLGWFKLATGSDASCDGARWWRTVLTEAIARQAALAIHTSQVIQSSRVEERRKAILEERNRLARDIHDNLAQGFGAILMQLQAAQRDIGTALVPFAQKIETAIDLARTHMVEARRSVGRLRPNVGEGEPIATALKRIGDRAQMTTTVPIEFNLDELPRVGDVVEREIVGIAQEALTNAVRHARARRITVRASAARSLGIRLSVADDGRGFARERSSSGFGLISMQERAERIGASLTIVTAPRGGTEIVLAWEPSSLPVQVHVAI
jgi:signal transduction histidine kinase